MAHRWRLNPDTPTSFTLAPIRMQPIRLGQFTDSYPPVINGVSTFVAEHHAELLRHDHDAHVFTFGYLKYPDDQRNVWRSFAMPMGRTQFRTWPQLDRRSQQAAESMTIMHIHEAVGIGHLGLRITKRLHLPFVFTNHTRHDLYAQHYPLVVRAYILNYTQRAIRQFVHASALTTAPSHDSARWLQSIVPEAADRIRVVHNGVLINVFDQSSGQPDRSALNIGADQTLFIYVGRITPEKNLKMLATAMVHAVERGAEVHWLIIGDGSARREIEAIAQPIRSHVSFLGALPHVEIPHYLNLADVFITASLSEVNPISVIEALACQKPYIGLKAAWWDEFANDAGDQAGVLCDHDPDQLAAAIKRVANDKAAQAHMGEQAKLLSRNFDIHNVTAQWSEIYQRIESEQGLVRGSNK
jgi:1,2-diacylglycerol 3-alpha-glucosyltransferase